MSPLVTCLSGNSANVIIPILEFEELRRRREEIRQRTLGNAADEAAR